MIYRLILERREGKRRKHYQQGFRFWFQQEQHHSHEIVNNHHIRGHSDKREGGGVWLEKTRREKETSLD